jgi:hypothetical protein
MLRSTSKIINIPRSICLETHGSEKIVHDPQELETNKNQIIATLKKLRYRYPAYRGNGWSYSDVV